ncbi:MAG: hypothetical protein GY761_01310 [Hyphomicrobiales bacterium]|nr:hypothetical protein [Hyphomicrobiales bacterium]
MRKPAIIFGMVAASLLSGYWLTPLFVDPMLRIIRFESSDAVTDAVGYLAYGSLATFGLIGLIAGLGLNRFLNHRNQSSK